MSGEELPEIGHNPRVRADDISDATNAAFKVLNDRGCNFETAMSVGETIIANSIYTHHARRGRQFDIEKFLKAMGSRVRQALAVLEGR